MKIKKLDRNIYEEGANLIYEYLDSDLKSKRFFQQAKKINIANQQIIKEKFDLNFSKMTLQGFLNGPDNLSKENDRIKLIDNAQKYNLKTDFHNILEINAKSESNKGADEIISRFNFYFDQKFLDIGQLANLKSFFLLKINHGFWEYLRYSFSDISDVNKFRERTNILMYKRRLKGSGYANFLGFLIYRYFINLDESVFFCLSLKNGLSKSSFSKFSNINLSAAAGMLAFFYSINHIGNNLYNETITDDSKIPFLDSECIKRLIYDESDFLEKILKDSDEVLFVGNRKLLNIYSNHGGVRYFYQIPDQTVNENFFLVVSGYLGTLKNILNQNKKVTILCESAAVSSALGLLTSFLLRNMSNEIKFIDLGRAMHFAREGFCEKNGFNISYREAARKNFTFGDPKTL